MSKPYFEFTVIDLGHHGRDAKFGRLFRVPPKRGEYILMNEAGVAMAYEIVAIVHPTGLTKPAEKPDEPDLFDLADCGDVYVRAVGTAEKLYAHLLSSQSSTGER